VIDDQLMSLRFPIALVLSIACFTTPAWADFETGMDAYERGNYGTALSEWRPLAKKGDAQAQLHLGMLYHQARGVPQDSTTARQWYEKAAAQGNAWAQVQLGQLHANGDGVSQDYAKARQWYEKAAAQGYARAQSNLGSLYADGKGVPQDETKGAEWIRKAAEQRDANGQASLGEMYRDGRGVPQDKLQAYMWLTLGVANGATRGAALRDALAKQMTPDQLAEAQKLAREWKPIQK